MYLRLTKNARRVLSRFYETNSVASEEQVAVLEVDFYRADSFVDMDDNEIIDLTLRAVSATLHTDVINTDDVIEAKVLRARNAVSHFSPNSALYSPEVKLKKGIYMAGDWVDRTGHASWSTEKSVVTARQAARALSKDFQLGQSACNVIPAALDTPQLKTMRYLAKTRHYLHRLGFWRRSYCQARYNFLDLDPKTNYIINSFLPL